jgi:hypothetical protein
MNARRLYPAVLLALGLSLALTLSGCAKPHAPKTDLGYGWSVNDSETQAAEEAVRGLKKNIATPDLTVMYATAGYDLTKLLTAVRTQIPGSIVFGITSCYGVMTKDGVHVGKKGSLALLGLASPEMKIGIAGRNVKDPQMTSALVKDAAEEAVQKALLPPQAKPTMILLGTTPGLEERSLEALRELFGKETPIYGSTAADNAMEGKWATFANDQVIRSGVSVVILYTQGKISHSFASGYPLAKKPKNGIANTDGRTLLSLDNKPAADIYNEWTNGLIKDDFAQGGSILAKTNLYPLARKFTSGQTDMYVSLHPASVNPQTKALTLFAEVPKGEALYLLQGDEASLLNRSAATVQLALQNAGVTNTQIAGGLHLYSAGSMLAVQKSIAQIVPSLNAALGNAPFIGAFTFGEQGPVLNQGNQHGNLMNSVVLFEKN